MKTLTLSELISATLILGGFVMVIGSAFADSGLGLAIGVVFFLLAGAAALWARHQRVQQEKVIT